MPRRCRRGILFYGLTAVSRGQAAGYKEGADEAAALLGKVTKAGMLERARKQVGEHSTSPCAFNPECGIHPPFTADLTLGSMLCSSELFQFVHTN